MKVKGSLINNRYGKLVVKREIDEDTFHCVCDCGSYRTVSRERLTRRDIDCCTKCAAENRRAAGTKRIEDPVEIKPQPEAPLPCVGCYIEGGWLIVQPDCKRHGIVTINPLLGQGTRDWIYAE